MANKTLFQNTGNTGAPPRSSKSNPKVRQATEVNEAGGKAYAKSDKLALATLVCTGTFNDTFYATAKDQLDKVLDLANKVPVDYLAKLAVYARKNAYMKDAPAALAAVLAARDVSTLDKVFDRVIDSPKMLRNFVQIVRSGKAGRSNFGTAVKRMMQRWLNNRTDDQIFKGSVGNNPSFSTVLMYAHAHPVTEERRALYGYLRGKEHNARKLPQLVKHYETFKAGKVSELPDVPFEMLTSAALTDSQWKDLAMQSSWTQLRMNLNTFARHGVFSDKKVVAELEAKLSDESEVLRSRCFPYQIMTAYLNVDEKVPAKLRNALQTAMETAVRNIPTIDGQVVVFPDVSGSMSSAATGNRKGSTSVVSCIQVAALISSCVLRTNPDALVLPFDTSIHKTSLNPRDSIITNAAKLAAYGGGGTNVSLTIRHLQQHRIDPKLVWIVSDNMSWQDWQGGYGTEVQTLWHALKGSAKDAKIVLHDIQPYGTSQLDSSRSDVLAVAGFSDAVFDVVSDFANDELGKDRWVSRIEEVVV